MSVREHHGQTGVVVMHVKVDALDVTILHSSIAVRTPLVVLKQCAACWAFRERDLV